MATAAVVGLALFSAALLFLRLVAPKTKTLADDKVLAALEKVEPVVEALEKK